jgi:N-acetylneuraminic acid mutarotase
MRHRPWLYATLGLAVAALASCGEEATQPNAAGEQKVTAPELAVVHNSWITRRDMWGIDRKDFATATVADAAGQSIVYVIGGRGASDVGVTSVMAYNVATNTWTLRAPLPFPLYGAEAAVINGKIYVTGGYSSDYPVNRTLMYDPAKNIWVTKRPMPATLGSESDIAGGGGVSGVINGKLYVATQGFSTNTASPPWYYPADDMLLRYNPVTDRWTSLAWWPWPPYLTIDPGMGGVIGGKLYLVGLLGTGEGQGALAVYDPATNQWTAKRGLGRFRYRAASVVHAGKLYLIGGTRWNADGTSEVLRANIAYDPTTDRWTNYAPLPTARTGLGGARVTLNGQPRLEVIGGSRPGNNLQYIP